MPKPLARHLTKASLLTRLQAIDNDAAARARVLQIETGLAERLNTLEVNLASREKFKELGTSPLVLLAHAKMAGLSHVAQLEGDLLMAKRFSSIETSIGRMVEDVTLPVYEWRTVPSGMQSVYSVVDGERVESGVVRFLTLKSGYNTLNDASGHSIAQEVVKHYEGWAADKGVEKVIFTFATLYGTANLSNKKDWHILRNVHEELSRRGATVVTAPESAWTSEYRTQDLTLVVDVKHGSAYWEYLGQALGADAFVEFAVAFVRASVRVASDLPIAQQQILLNDLADIANVTHVPAAYNVSLLQRSQLAWLFMFASYYCDKLEEFAAN